MSASTKTPNLHIPASHAISNNQQRVSQVVRSVCLCLCPCSLPWYPIYLSAYPAVTYLSPATVAIIGNGNHDNCMQVLDHKVPLLLKAKPSSDQHSISAPNSRPNSVTANSTVGGTQAQHLAISGPAVPISAGGLVALGTQGGPATAGQQQSGVLNVHTFLEELAKVASEGLAAGSMTVAGGQRGQGGRPWDMWQKQAVVCTSCILSCCFDTCLQHTGCYIS